MALESGAGEALSWRKDIQVYMWSTNSFSLVFSCWIILLLALLIHENGNIKDTEKILEICIHYIHVAEKCMIERLALCFKQEWTEQKNFTLYMKTVKLIDSYSWKIARIGCTFFKRQDGLYIAAAGSDSHTHTVNLAVLPTWEWSGRHPCSPFLSIKRARSPNLFLIMFWVLVRNYSCNIHTSCDVS